MDWPKRQSPFRKPPMKHHAVLPHSRSASPTVVIGTEGTDPELERLDGINVLMPENVELFALNDADTILPKQGRITASKLINSKQIEFSFVATTTDGVTMIARLKAGTATIIPLIVPKADGGIRVDMRFKFTEERQT